MRSGIPKIGAYQALWTAGLVAAVLLGVLSCAVNPVSGERQLMLLSETEEIELGKQTDTQIVKQYGAYDDAELTVYLSGIGERMARLSHRPNLAFRFRVLDAPVVNAFAVPGGYIYLTRGILAYLNDEAEMAGIMGHEIGHVTARHSAQAYSRAQLAQVGLGLGAVLSETFRSVAGLAEMGVGMLFLRFSRDNEREADDLGVEYASKAGYQAARMADFFDTLERLHPSSDRSGLPAWFSTHPNPVDRSQAVRRGALQWQEKLDMREPQVNRDRYLREIDGLLFGEDPKHGYEEDGTFYHPELRFQFPVPRDWDLRNTPAQVRMAPKEGDAAVLFAIDSKNNTYKAAAEAFVQGTKAAVQAHSTGQVHGFPVLRIVSDIQSEQGPLRVLSHFIQGDRLVYVFHGFSATQEFERYRDEFGRIMGGFRALTDPAKIHVEPYRIRVRPAPAAGTVRDALVALGVKPEDVENMAVLNGVQSTDTVSRGTLVKIVAK